MAASEPIRSKKQLKKMAGYYLLRGQLRNHALIVLGVHTALRISDLLRLTWDDIYDFRRGEFRRHVTLVERKTGKAKTIALNREAVAALRLYFPHRRGDFLFANSKPNNVQQSNRTITGC